MRTAVLTLALVSTVLAMSSRTAAVEPASSPTFTKDIAPMLQRSCQGCHRPDSIAPMSLITYEDVRPWARAIKQRTGLNNRMGVMPPWFIEKNVGIQSYKDDISLNERDIATIAAWVDSGAPRGNPADMPPPRVFASNDNWDIGEPDLIVDGPPVTIKAGAPDWWGIQPPVPTGLKEDRYVSAVQIKEISSVKGGVGGRFIIHHAQHQIANADGTPGGLIGGIHEVGRNAEYFEPEAGRLMKAGSQLVFPSTHVHANPTQDITAHLRFGYKFHPKGYTPRRRVGSAFIGSLGTSEIDLRPNTAGQTIDLYATLREHMMFTTFEPHLHAAGVRMCLEAIWGGRRETLTCAGYDHNWVRIYKYADDAAPLLPRGTLLHVTAWFDTTAANRNVVDPRNWSGLGHRTIDNMAILMAPGIVLNDQEFQEEIARRRERLHLVKGQTVLGCPLCAFDVLPPLDSLTTGPTQRQVTP